MKRKLNVKRLVSVIVVILLIILAIVFMIINMVKDSKYKKTYEYKLLEIGYSTNEVNTILDFLEDKQIDSLLKIKYDVSLVKFLKEKYFIFDNLDRYMTYNKKHEGKKANEIISIVNASTDLEWYTNIEETDTSKGILMLVNRFNKLEENYEPEELQKVSATYAYDGKYVDKVMYDDLISMLSNAKEEGYKLVVSQGYRSYKDQEEAYKAIENSSSTEQADKLAARPGHSEYQTGLSVVVEPYNKIVSDVNESEEHEWLINNCYKYGFILRYPENKENITGFNADAWRLRYVGSEVASKIHEENITFDEYYAYYLNN